MRDLMDILREWEWPENRPESLALATLVTVEGSTYRRPGARMLILPDGRRIGALSGGCLEADVAERARQLRGTGDAALLVYDAHTGFDMVLEMGCEGGAGILVEPASRPGPPRALRFLSECVRLRRKGAIATVFRVEGAVDAAIGDGLTYSSGVTTGAIADAALAAAVAADLASAAAAERSLVKTYRLPDGSATVLVEAVLPPLALMVCGAGPDSVPLARLAGDLGWQVTVVDHRPAFASSDRFPASVAVVHASAGSTGAVPGPDARTAVVIMSHNYDTDRAWLGQFLPSAASYVGLLGPRRRADRLLADLRNSGPDIGDERLVRLYNPAGLDIGAETPEEIALAILAEIQAAFTHHPGAPLRQRNGPIHQATPTLISDPTASM
jgi:xanthine/CO dehydrogenase XdhC/CoxF family maturation factor